MPTTPQPGQCSLPYTISLGTNAFNNQPASGLTLSTVGTTCGFGSTGDQGEKRSSIEFLITRALD
jgi:hypothetical protein